MHISDQKPLVALGNLLRVNHDRIRGYHFAREHTDVSVLRVLFTRLAQSSMQCSAELSREIYKLGGSPPAESAPGDFEKVWMEVRDALFENNHAALLEACYIGEFMVYKSYEYTLRYYSDVLTTQLRGLFERQLQLLRDDHVKVQNLRNVLLQAA
jgi:uncharacterized protein (TIGR02284 family)